MAEPYSAVSIRNWAGRFVQHFEPRRQRHFRCPSAIAKCWVLNVTKVGRTMDKLDIRPFKIHISDIDVADLSERIKRTRWPDEYQNSNWDTRIDKPI
jgi:hypothetical protein